MAGQGVCRACRGGIAALAALLAQGAAAHRSRVHDDASSGIRAGR